LKRDLYSAVQFLGAELHAKTFRFEYWLHDANHWAKSSAQTKKN